MGNFSHVLISAFPCSLNPFEVHRVMMWVNRDVSVLIRTRKADIFYLYETIKNLLPRLKLDSEEFRKPMIHFFGANTDLFIHELINFARSPYDTLMAYECSTQYRALLDFDNGPSTSAKSRDREFLSTRLHSFVEFTRRINYDDCGGFEADLELEDEDFGELDDMMMERYGGAPFLMKMDGQLVTARIIPSSQANAPNQGQVNQQTQSQAQAQAQAQAQVQAQAQAQAQTQAQTQAQALAQAQAQAQVQAQPQAQVQQAAAQPAQLLLPQLTQAVIQTQQRAVHQPQQSGQQSGPQHASSTAALATPLEDLELGFAIERSMFVGASNADQGGDFILPYGQVFRFANTNRAARPSNGNGSGSGVMNPPPAPPVPNNPRNASAHQGRRRRTQNQR